MDAELSIVVFVIDEYSVVNRLASFLVGAGELMSKNEKSNINKIYIGLIFLNSFCSHGSL